MYPSYANGRRATGIAGPGTSLPDLGRLSVWGSFFHGARLKAGTLSGKVPWRVRRMHRRGPVGRGGSGFSLRWSLMRFDAPTKRGAGTAPPLATAASALRRREQRSTRCSGAGAPNESGAHGERPPGGDMRRRERKGSEAYGETKALNDNETGPCSVCSRL